MPKTTFQDLNLSLFSWLYQKFCWVIWFWSLKRLFCLYFWFYNLNFLSRLNKMSSVPLFISFFLFLKKVLYVLPCLWVYLEIYIDYLALRIVEEDILPWFATSMLTKLLGPAIMLVRVVGVIVIVDLRLLIVLVRMSLSLFLFELYFLLFYSNFSLAALISLNSLNFLFSELPPN